MKHKFIKFTDMHREAMKDPEFRKEYQALEPEFAIIRAIMDKRAKKEMSQKDLAKKLGTNQSAVSRLESGTYNPTLKFLKKVAEALDTQLKITFL